jgi:DNA-binding HxlR family transcriptional regulator
MNENCPELECTESGTDETTSEDALLAAQKAAMPTFCPIAETLNLLHEKWTLHIVHALLLGKKRFNEIGHALGGVNPRTLRERLRSLEEEGIVTRHVISTMPPWVEYELTAKGHALQPLMDAMAEWSRNWVTRE